MEEGSSSIAGPAVWPVLKPASAEQDPRSVRVNRKSCVVGARSLVHLPLASPLVSRSHALIVVDAREVYVRDLASKNRVFVNDSAVREAALRSADLLRVGPYTFRCIAGFPKEADADERESNGHCAHLAVVGSDRSHRLDSRTFLVGRREDCDLAMDFPLVSHVHAVIFRRGGRHFVRDLNSKNGTFVNARRIREAELQDGDEVRIAATILRYEAAAAETAPELEVSSAAAGGELSGSWRSNADMETMSHMFLASGSIGGQTAAGSGTVQGPEPYASADPQAPAAPATAEDFGFSELNAAQASFSSSSEPDLATGAELFPSELNVPPTAGSPAAGNNGDIAHHNGEVVNHNGDGVSPNGDGVSHNGLFTEPLNPEP